MPSEAGRGAQVLLDDDARRAARGATGGRLMDNLLAKRAAEVSGATATGDRPDGSTTTGAPADDVVIATSGLPLTDPAVAALFTAHTGNTSNPHSVTAAQVGAYTAGAVDTLVANEATARTAGDTTNAAAISAHTARTDNPHAVTAAQVPFTGSGTGAVPQTVASVLDMWVSPERFGAVGGTADDTAALQAAITYAQGLSSNGRPGCTLRLGGKQYRHTGLTISRPIVIDGEGGEFRHLSTATAPELTIAAAHGGYNYFSDGYPPCAIFLRNLSFRGDATAAQDGLALSAATTNPTYCALFVENCDWYFSGRDSLTGNAWNGYATFDNCRWRRGGRDQHALTGCYDIRFNLCDLSTATRYSVNLNDCSEVRYVTTYIYSSNGDGVLVTESGVSFHGGSIDRHKGTGLIYNNASYRGVSIVECNFALNGAGTAETYSDVLVKAGSNGKLTISDGIFADPAASNTKYNMEFETGAGVAQVIRPNWQQGRSNTATSITNDFAKLYQISSTTSGHALHAPLYVTTGTQFRGMSLRTQANKSVVEIKGYDADNGTGAVECYDSTGALFQRLSAYSAQTRIVLPGAYADDAAAATAGVPVNCAYRHTSGVVAWRIS